MEEEFVVDGVFFSPLLSRDDVGRHGTISLSMRLLLRVGKRSFGSDDCVRPAVGGFEVIVPRVVIQ